EAIASLRGHTAAVQCIAVANRCAGDLFATGGADKSVILWNGNPGSPTLRFPHRDALVAVAFSPTAPLLLSVSESDFGIWRQDHPDVNKHNLPSKPSSCAWAADGGCFVIGFHNGDIMLVVVGSDDSCGSGR